MKKDVCICPDVCSCCNPPMIVKEDPDCNGEKRHILEASPAAERFLSTIGYSWNEELQIRFFQGKPVIENITIPITLPV